MTIKILCMPVIPPQIYYSYFFNNFDTSDMAESLIMAYDNKAAGKGGGQVKVPLARKPSGPTAQGGPEAHHS